MQGLAAIYAKNVEGDWKGAWVEASQGAGNQVVVEREVRSTEAVLVMLREQGLGVSALGECSQRIVWREGLKVRETGGKKEGLDPLSFNGLSTFLFIPFFSFFFFVEGIVGTGSFISFVFSFTSFVSEVLG